MDKVESSSPLAHKMSSSQLRKIKKPIIEKRRRERINDSLNQLKGLVLDAMQKDESRYSKMEKADILEMTVHHLKLVQRQQIMMQSNEEKDVAQKYTAGFSECANEVGQLLGSIDGMAPEVRLRLMSHLSQRMQKVLQRGASPVGQMQGMPPSPVYQGSMSPPLVVSPIAVSPSASPASTLPGSPPYSPQPASPTMLATSPLNVSLPPGVMVLSPTSSPVTSHSPNAIPLYVSDGNFYKVRVTPPSSPSPSDDASQQYSPEVLSRNSVITKNIILNNNNNLSLMVPNISCKSEARITCHNDNFVHMSGSMWRPW